MERAHESLDILNGRSWFERAMPDGVVHWALLHGKLRIDYPNEWRKIALDPAFLEQFDLLFDLTNQVAEIRSEQFFARWSESKGGRVMYGVMRGDQLLTKWIGLSKEGLIHLKDWRRRAVEYCEQEDADDDEIPPLEYITPLYYDLTDIDAKEIAEKERRRKRLEERADAKGKFIKAKLERPRNTLGVPELERGVRGVNLDRIIAQQRHIYPIAPDFLPPVPVAPLNENEVVVQDNMRRDAVDFHWDLGAEGVEVEHDDLLDEAVEVVDLDDHDAVEQEMEHEED